MPATSVIFLKKSLRVRHMSWISSYLRLFSTGTASWLVTDLVPVVTRMIQPESILKGFSTWFISSILTNLIRFFWCWDPKVWYFLKALRWFSCGAVYEAHTHKKTLNSLTDNTVIRYHTYNCWVITTQQITQFHTALSIGTASPCVEQNKRFLSHHRLSSYSKAIKVAHSPVPILHSTTNY